jgi:hypothetical protein
MRVGNIDEHVSVVAVGMYCENTTSNQAQKTKSETGPETKTLSNALMKRPERANQDAVPRKSRRRLFGARTTR